MNVSLLSQCASSDRSCLEVPGRHASDSQFLKEIRNGRPVKEAATVLSISAAQAYFSFFLSIMLI